MSLILGINAAHGDSAACILRDGVLVAAAEEERFRRVKHFAGFPTEAVRYCLRECGASLAGVEHIAINQDRSAHVGRKIAYTLLHRPSLRLLSERIRTKRERARVADHLEREFEGARFAGRVHQVEHHLAHLSSAFHVSPFEEAVVVSVDGFGDFASGAWGVGRGSAIAVHDRVYFPHSLGIFYQAVTQYLGFPQYGDEYKVMGLAPYGEPAHMEAMRKLVRLGPRGSYRLGLDYFSHHVERNVLGTDAAGSPIMGNVFSPRMEQLLGPRRKPGDPLEQRHKDIARSTQAMYEEAFFHLLRSVHARAPLDCLALAGGCAMNSVANGKITLNTPFTQVYVQSAAGDAGGAIGAAYTVWHESGGARPKPHTHAYWGPSYGPEAMEAVLEARRQDLEAGGCRVTRAHDESTLVSDTASAIARGEVVGWFQGRMEWGPRALGNRSILGDPRRADMKDILNLKIKRRESFRPFAPSILREEAAAWFELDADVPFMMQVFPIRAVRRASIPAVTHVDGSGRLQTVTREANPRYHALISEFARLTGVPMVLNTSFNENEPVVCTPAEALDCFLRTKMDRLVLGDHVVLRASSP